MKRDYGFFAGAATCLCGYVAGAITVLLRGGDGNAVEAFLAAEVQRDWLSALLAGPGHLLPVLGCGLFLFGWLVALPLVFYRTFGLGYTAGLFLSALGTKGFLPLGLCLFPSAAGECLLLIRAVREALPQSWDLFRGRLGDNSAFAARWRGYCLRGIVSLQLSSALMLWDLYLSPLILSGIRDLL